VYAEYLGDGLGGLTVGHNLYSPLPAAFQFGSGSNGSAHTRFRCIGRLKGALPRLDPVGCEGFIGLPVHRSNVTQSQGGQGIILDRAWDGRLHAIQLQARPVIDLVRSLPEIA
jgi:hypothetical protein